VSDGRLGAEYEHLNSTDEGFDGECRGVLRVCATKHWRANKSGMISIALSSAVE